MRRLVWSIGLGLSLPILSGCFLFNADGKPIWQSQAGRKDNFAQPGSVFTDVAPVSLTIGDPLINDELWIGADEQILSPELRQRLHDNGFRVGVIRGRSDNLLSLTSKKQVRENGRTYVRRPGIAAKLDPLANHDDCEFLMPESSGLQTRQFERAVCRFQVTPSQAADGKVTLRFCPEIEFEDNEKWRRLNPGVALAVQGQRSTEAFTGLAWEVSLSRNEFVLIGTRLERPRTLGAKFFIDANPEQPAQKLLVIRADMAGKNSNTSGSRVTPSPSLAAQAASK